MKSNKYTDQVKKINDLKDEVERLEKQPVGWPEDECPNTKYIRLEQTYIGGGLVGFEFVIPLNQYERTFSIEEAKNLSDWILKVTDGLESGTKEEIKAKRKKKWLKKVEENQNEK